MQLAFQDNGQGDSMRFTLIRGLSREHFHWDGFPEKMRTYFPQCEIEFLDLLGNGDYYKETSPADPMAHIEFLRSHSKFVREKKKTHVIALSLGAMLACEWSYLYPEEIGSLVLMNMSLRPTPFYRRIRPSGLLKLMGAIRTKDHRDRERKVLELTTRLLGPRLDSLAQSWGERAETIRTNRQSAINQLIVAAKMRARKEKPTMPCLLLSSLGDGLVNPHSSSELADLWHVPHRVHPTAGHDLTVDDPEWCLHQMRDFYLAYLNEKQFKTAQ